MERATAALIQPLNRLLIKEETDSVSGSRAESAGRDSLEEPSHSALCPQLPHGVERSFESSLRRHDAVRLHGRLDAVDGVARSPVAQAPQRSGREQLPVLEVL